MAAGRVRIAVGGRFSAPGRAGRVCIRVTTGLAAGERTVRTPAFGCCAGAMVRRSRRPTGLAGFVARMASLSVVVTIGDGGFGVGKGLALVVDAVRAGLDVRVVDTNLDALVAGDEASLASITPSTSASVHGATPSSAATSLASASSAVTCALVDTLSSTIPKRRRLGLGLFRGWPTQGVGL